MKCKLSASHHLVSCSCDTHRFRWVTCQLEMLRHCFPASLRDALCELPETLDKTYERILLGIKPGSREYPHRLLQCLTVVVRPLRAEELAEVLAIRFLAGKHPEYHSGWCLGCSRRCSICMFKSNLNYQRRWVTGRPVFTFLCKGVPHIGSSR